MSDTCRHCGSQLDWEEGCGGLFCPDGCDQTRPAETCPWCRETKVDGRCPNSMPQDDSEDNG